MARSQTTQLLLRAKNGDDHALNDLYYRCGPRLLALIRLRMGGARIGMAEPEDLAQEVLLKAFSQIEAFQKDTSKSLFAWLATIATNTIRDQVAYGQREKRDRRRTQAIHGLEATVSAKHRSAISQLLIDEQLQRLEAQLAQLNEKDRDLILLRRFQEWSYEEMGNSLGMSTDAARMAYQRAMVKLTAKMTHA